MASVFMKHAAVRQENGADAGLCLSVGSETKGDVFGS